MLKNLVMNFVRDERGAESSEIGVSTVLYAGGSVAAGTALKEVIQTKQGQITTALGNTSLD
jgi:Flp pilus assembly pilin Flp